MESPRDYNQWVKSVERRLKEALRAGQSPQAVRIARDLTDARDRLQDVEMGVGQTPAAPVELQVGSRVLKDNNGNPFGEISLDFPAVTVSTDAKPIEVDRYEMWVEDLDAEEEEEEEGDSWRTNLVDDPETEYWRGRFTPQTKQVADLEVGTDIQVGDRLSFTVTVDTFAVNDYDPDELMHSVRLSAFRKVYEGDPMPWDREEDEPEEDEEPVDDDRPYRIVEHQDWQIRTLPEGNEGDTSTRTVETYEVSGTVPRDATRITAHFAGSIRGGHIEFINPVLHNMSETRPETPTMQGMVMGAVSIEPSLIQSNLRVGGNYRVRARAIASGVPGPLSESRDVTIQKDTTPPPIPSPLELSSIGATVTTVWDTLTATGARMPGDFVNTEIAFGYLPAPTEVIGSLTLLFSQYIFETPPQPDDDDFDGTWYFRHRSVDSSGNRSPWSQQSSIVPKSLVDEASIRFELDAHNERLEQARADMQTEIGKANDRIADFREEWESEWDDGRLKDIQDRQGTLQANIDSARKDAADALKDFDEAWSAEWDSTISGLRTRQDTLDSDIEDGLNGANARIDSLAVGDLFVENAIKAPAIDARSLTASQAFIDLLDVNLLQARLLEAGEARIGGSLIKDNTISTEKMLIGPSNLMSDAFFTTLDARESVAWYPSTRAAFGVVNLAWSDRPAIRLLSPYTENNTNHALWFGGGSNGDKAMPVEPGDVIKVRFQVLRYSGWSNDHNYNVSARWRDGQAQGLSYSSLSYFTEVGNQDWHEAEFTAPEGAYYFAIRWIFNSGRGDTHGARGITNISIRRMTGADLIVDGAVLAQHINTESLGADTAFIDLLETNLLRARLLEADSAMIGGNALMDDSIATRHLVVTNTQDLWNEVWWEDLFDNTYIFSPGGAMGSDVFARNFQSTNPPNLDSSSFDWRYTTLQGDRGIQTWPVNSTLNQRAAFRMGPGKGIPVRPGEKYTLRFRSRDLAGSGFYNIDMALFDVESGDPVPHDDAPRFSAAGVVHGSSGEIVWTFEIPDNFPRMHMVPSINSQNTDDSGARSFLRPQLTKAMDGKLIVDGLVQANRAILDELFFDDAVGNSIIAGAGRFLEVEAGQIAANAVTADKINFGSLNGALITGLQIQTHTNNRGVKLTSAGIRAFNSSGSQTFTVNASNGDVSVNGGTITGATFQTSSSIFGSSNGGVRISGDSSGGTIEVSNSSANRVFRAGANGAEIDGSLTVRSADVRGSITVGGNGEGRLSPSGDRFDIQGRVPELDNMSSETTFMAMSTPYSQASDWYENFHTGTLKLVRITYPKAAPRGARLPLGIMNLNGSNRVGRGSSASITRNRTNAYFNIAMGFSDTITTGDDPTFAITVLSTWGQTTPGGFVGT